MPLALRALLVIKEESWIHSFYKPFGKKYQKDSAFLTQGTFSPESCFRAAWPFTIHSQVASTHLKAAEVF